MPCARLGEVQLRPHEDGPVTIVTVDRDLRDDSWWVLGARSEQIVVDEPAHGAVLDDFVHVVGTTVSESGVLDVELRVDDERHPLLVADIPTGGIECRMSYVVCRIPASRDRSSKDLVPR